MNRRRFVLALLVISFSPGLAAAPPSLTPADIEHHGSGQTEMGEQQRFTPAFAELMRYEVDQARDLFYRGLPLVDLVPADVRLDIELFARGGLAILRKIEQIGYNVWQTRPKLAKWEKAALLTGALWRRVQAALF